MTSLLSRAAQAKIAALWLLWSVVTLALAAAFARIPGSAPNGWGAELTAIAPPLARWDAGWYYGIATSGYHDDPTQSQNPVGFYPLYPLVVGAAARVVHAPVFETGIAVSLVCVLAALLIVARLAGEWGSGDAAPALAGCLLVFPSAFYLAAFYSESLFLFASAAAIWAARRRAWLWAGVAGAAACLTRFNGFLIALPILACMASEPERRERGRMAAGLALVVAGAAAFPVYLWRRWGDPLLYLHDKAKGWPSLRFGRFWLALPRLAAGLLRNAPWTTRGIVTITEALSLLVVVAGAVHLFRRRLLPEGIWVASTVVLVSLSGSFEALQRYALVLFPAFLLPAVLARRSRVFALAWSAVGCGLAMALMFRFVHWIFVG